MDRWIFASIGNHFSTKKDATLTLYIEGMHRVDLNQEEFIELRSDGPYYTEVSKGYWKVYVEINVLAQCAKNNTNFHRMRQLTGTIMSLFEPCIEVFKFGTGTDDTQESVGVLRRMDQETGRNNMQVNHFGQVDPTTQLEQATVESHYVMFVEE
jgi:hypothetical protein